MKSLKDFMRSKLNEQVYSTIVGGKLPTASTTAGGSICYSEMGVSSDTNTECVAYESDIDWGGTFMYVNPTDINAAC